MKKKKKKKKKNPTEPLLKIGFVNADASVVVAEVANSLN
jgi:hypothetical protein